MVTEGENCILPSRVKDDGVFKMLGPKKTKTKQNHHGGYCSLADHLSPSQSAMIQSSK